MDVVLGERNKEMNGTALPSTFHKLRASKFGSRGSLGVPSCRTERTCEDRSEKPKYRSFRILRVYFRKRIHSSVVGSLLKVFQIQWLEWGGHILTSAVLTLYPPGLQISSGKVFNNRRNPHSGLHNSPNTVSSKLLQQHARATALVSPPAATSSRATRRMISSTQRLGCIEAGRYA